MNESDKELAERIKKSDANSFKSLYFRYHQQLIKFAFYRIGSEELSSDFVQEVFIKLWEKRTFLNSGKSIKAYLYKSLNNKIIDYYKSASSKNLSLNKEEFKNLYSFEEDNDSSIDIKTAIESLPEKLKLVYTLSRFDGYKYSEIAEICGISVKTVEKRMSMTFSLLKKYFK